MARQRKRTQIKQRVQNKTDSLCVILNENEQQSKLGI